MYVLAGLQNAASGTANQSHGEIQGEGQVDSSPFDRLAAKLGLPTNCDIDLRRQEELEVTERFVSTWQFSEMMTMLIGIQPEQMYACSLVR